MNIFKKLSLGKAGCVEDILLANGSGGLNLLDVSAVVCAKDPKITGCNSAGFGNAAC
jgi:hypothetical protein